MNFLLGHDLLDPAVGEHPEIPVGVGRGRDEPQVELLRLDQRVELAQDVAAESVDDDVHALHISPAQD